jgi:hypothetical protein
MREARDSMDNMGREPCPLIWPVSPTFRVAKSTRSSIIRWSRRVCTCLPISSSSGLQSQVVRSRDLCSNVPVGTEGVLCRVVVATHPAANKKSTVGLTRAGVVYELFFTAPFATGLHRCRRRRAVSTSRRITVLL